MSGRVTRLGCRLLALALLAGLGTHALAQPNVSVSEPQTIDQKTTACLGLHVAATNPWNVTVGWATADARGVCYRQRLNLLWEPVKTVGGNLGRQPRDLDMAYDRLGRLHLVWTGLEGRVRKVYHARLDGAKATPQGALLLTAEGGDADFPAISPDDDGGMVVVWQESREMRFSIRAARVPAAGEVQDLGRVSGDSLSGMAPQVISTGPALQVAWYEISESGSELRVDEWQPQERRWRPSATEREAHMFPKNEQLLLDRTTEGLLACWQEVREDGHSAIKMELSQPAAFQTKVLAEPPGEHTRPSTSGTLPGRLTLAWQVFAQGYQRIRIAALQRADQTPEVVTVSGAAHRFAAMPEHVTLDNWSAVVWTDDVREGGGGGIYFAQISWAGQS